MRVTPAGSGRSGFGGYGQTTSASPINRRPGFNTPEAIEAEKNGNGRIVRDAFHDLGHLRSLENRRETITGPGRSGGPSSGLALGGGGGGGGKNVGSTVWRAC